MVYNTQKIDTKKPTEEYNKVNIPTTLPLETQKILKTILNTSNGRNGMIYIRNGKSYNASDWEHDRYTELGMSRYSINRFGLVPTNSIISTYDKNNQIIHYQLGGSKDNPFETIRIWNDKQGKWGESKYNGLLTNGRGTLYISPQPTRESNLPSSLQYRTNINSSLVITLPTLPVISKPGDSILDEPINPNTLSSITKLLSKPGKSNAYFRSNNTEYDFYTMLKTQSKSGITTFSNLPCGTILSSYNFKNEKVHYLITKITEKGGLFGSSSGWELSVWDDKKNQWLKGGYYAELESDLCAHVFKKASVDAKIPQRNDERIDRLNIYPARSEQLIVITVPDVDKLRLVPKKTK